MLLVRVSALFPCTRPYASYVIVVRHMRYTKTVICPKLVQVDTVIVHVPGESGAGNFFRALEVSRARPLKFEDDRNVPSNVGWDVQGRPPVNIRIFSSPSFLLSADSGKT